VARERPRQRRMMRPAWGEGRSLLPRPGLPEPREAVAAEEAAASGGEATAAKINVDKPLRVSNETADDVAVTETLPPPTDSKIGTKQQKHPSPSSSPALA
jgi:hypothetical protein